MSASSRPPFRALGREWALLRQSAGSPECREVLRWCLPALLVGALVRALLNAHFPYGYFQGDTPDFLITAQRFVKNHSLVIHGKKAFLAPILYTLPFLVHIPALLVIPPAQHLAGLVGTLAAGGIVRCWFRAWRWFIIPLTLLYTLNPALLWYEQALLVESLYLCCATLLALAGTLFVLRPTLRRFIWVIVALFFTAGSRPEGKLFVAFGLGVVALAYFGDWGLWAKRIAVMAVCSALIWMSARNTQAGLLLYATVLPLAPEVSKISPGVSPYLAPLREEALAKGETVRTRLNSVEKRTNNAVQAYLQAEGKPSDDATVSALCQKLAVEAMKNRPQALLPIATNKFLATFRPDMQGDFTDTSGGFTPYWLYDKQKEAMNRRALLKPLMRGLSGRDLRDNIEIDAFLHEKFQPLDPDWFSPLQRVWSLMTLGLQWDSHGADKRFIPGWPAFYLAAMAGMLAALIPRDRLWRFHLPWIAAFLGVWFAVMLTGVVNPRYRFVFEPFCLFYAGLLLDFLWSGAARLVSLRRKQTADPACP